jgi:hypothetical protein
MGNQEKIDHGNDVYQLTGDTATRGQHMTSGDNGAHPYVHASVPNVARIYDYLLNGKDNYSSDREAAAQLMRLIPDAMMACRFNRRFLQYAVRFLASSAGIRQFIDIGTGLPTQGNVHEIVQSVEPAARVLHVDNDPVVVSHAQALLINAPTVVAINRDLRYPRKIIEHPALQALIDLDQPVAILLVAVLHFIGDNDDPHQIVDELKKAIPAGSYLVLSHVTSDAVSAGVSHKVQQLYDRTNAAASPRTRAGIARFFDGLEMVDPGLVNVRSWPVRSWPIQSAQSELETTIFLGGIGRKP